MIKRNNINNTAKLPARIGSHSVDITCHFAGTELDPNVIAQIAHPSTFIG